VGPGHQQLRHARSNGLASHAGVGYGVGAEMGQCGELAHDGFCILNSFSN
jgi:hypothetical protein